MTTIAVIDHGAGNLVSIGRGLERTGATVVVADGPNDLSDIDGIVLPGVGTTTAAMKRLRSAGFIEPLSEWSGPLLGICVGLQLFFDSSEESGTTADPCLGWLPGSVVRLADAPLLPHIGWNDVATDNHRLFSGIPTGTPFYFVHSFAPQPADPTVTIGSTTYGASFASAVASGQRYGVQFHPERSGSAGLLVLQNFVTMCEEERRAA